MEHTYKIAGMSCKSCVNKVKTALESIDSVTSVNVSLNPPQATVQMTTHIPTQTLNNKLKELGDYSLTESMAPLKSDSSSLKNKQSLMPLFIILGYIMGGVILAGILAEDLSAHFLMKNFMGGFFIVFSLFKMIDLKGFAEGYSTYDLIAKRSRAYALTYPFLELSLGILYLSGLGGAFTDIATVLLMAVSSLGVAQALREKREIECACLGTSLKLPMTKVTLAEDLLMGVMALVQLWGI